MKKQDIQYMNTIKRLKKNIEKEEKKENKENKSSYKVIKKEAEQRNSVLRGVNENDNLWYFYSICIQLIEWFPILKPAENVFSRSVHPNILHELSFLYRYLLFFS